MKSNLDQALSASARATGILALALVTRKITRRQLLLARNRSSQVIKHLNELFKLNEGNPTDELTIPIHTT